MNIHFENTDLFNDLMKSTLISINIGSTMYGLEHGNSDTDVLCIYNTSDKELNSFTNTHYQFQFKKDNIDYLFVNIHTFLRNCLSGDSTINLEVIYSTKLIDTELYFLYENRKDFYNYKILRSYLGMARRDIKRINIDAKSEFNKNKKVAHAYRGLVSAQKIYSNDELYLNNYDITHIKDVIWNLKGDTERKIYCEVLSKEIDLMRDMINKSSKFAKYMDVENQIKLDNNLFDLLRYTKISKMKNFDMNLIYNVNENDMKY